MTLENSASEVLKDTSRTFYLSIVRLPPNIREAVMASYLSMRAIDEIEDHERLDRATKVSLLEEISRGFRETLPLPPRRFAAAIKEYRDDLPEVTRRLDEWVDLPIGSGGTGGLRRGATSTATPLASRVPWACSSPNYGPGTTGQRAAGETRLAMGAVYRR